VWCMRGDFVACLFALLNVCGICLPAEVALAVGC
jgi:hypothetical protein